MARMGRRGQRAIDLPDRSLPWVSVPMADGCIPSFFYPFYPSIRVIRGQVFYSSAKRYAVSRRIVASRLSVWVRS